MSHHCPFGYLWCNCNKQNYHNLAQFIEFPVSLKVICDMSMISVSVRVLSGEWDISNCIEYLYVPRRRLPSIYSYNDKIYPEHYLNNIHKSYLPSYSKLSKMKWNSQRRKAGKHVIPKSKVFKIRCFINNYFLLEWIK